MAKSRVQFFIDFKSPYAYLAVGPARKLQAATGIEFEWLPYTLDIPSYLGDAMVDAQGNVLKQSRNAHQWRRVKYSYMDCRRDANRSRSRSVPRGSLGGRRRTPARPVRQ